MEDEEEGDPPEFSLTGRNLTTEVANSRLNSMRMGYFISRDPMHGRATQVHVRCLSPERFYVIGFSESGFVEDSCVVTHREYRPRRRPRRAARRLMADSRWRRRGSLTGAGAERSLGKLRLLGMMILKRNRPPSRRYRPARPSSRSDDVARLTSYAAADGNDKCLFMYCDARSSATPPGDVVAAGSAHCYI
ncbi:hypothetical protein EVAR_39287_1 [Eumeta japonica]|uniref:Uncharacterized protein n=1 Tax=Eumeta variegata TaxID=151549 RepID=A0A4C1VXA4_EUMVA|nr:hypothetical protein EVAR_39287_1 [Eumeta japonica]